MQQRLPLFFWVSLLLAAMCAAGLGQTWRVGITPTYPETSFNDVFFVNATTGWIVGARGPSAAVQAAIVGKSTNGGTTWTFATIDSPRIAKSVFFLDANRGFVGGTARRFYLTTNGGSTWVGAAVTANPDTAADVRAIYFADTSRGWILCSTGSNGRVLHTTNGGSTWTLDTTITAKQMMDMHFSGPNRGIMTPGGVGAVAHLYYTANGVQWKNATAPTFPGTITYSRSDIRAVYMVDSLKAYGVGWGSTAAGLQPSIHIKTTDGGATWTYLTQDPANTSYDNLYGLWFKDSSNGIAVGGGIKGSVVERTTNGGVNWVPVVVPSGVGLNSVTGSGNNVWAVGDGGVILRSTDLGATWEFLTPIPGASLSGIQFVSPTVGFGAGFNGLFVKTTDGGKTWKGSFVYANRLSFNVQDIFFTSPTIGYAACSYRVVAKTTDGGDSWSRVIPDTLAPGVTSYGVYFTDASNGIVVGGLSTTSSVIYRTTDGGATWQTTTGTVAKRLRDVGFGSATIGAAVGEGRVGIYTTNGGSSWATSTFNGVPTNRASANLKGIRFLSTTNAIAVGDSTILKTTDGGANWNYVASIAKTALNSVDFANATTGYAVGSSEVLKTTDGGDTWTNVTGSGVVSGTLNSVGIDKNGNPWVGGPNGYVYTLAPLVGVNPQASLPTAFSLSQNYPNPFNPSTVVSCQLPVASRVRLVVYDILGREVTTLVDERKEAGTHQITFDATGLASGVYFYRLQAGDFVQTRSMLLLR